MPSKLISQLRRPQVNGTRRLNRFKFLPALPKSRPYHRVETRVGRNGSTGQAVNKTERFLFLWPLMFIACMVSAAAILMHVAGSTWLSSWLDTDTVLSEWIAHIGVAVVLLAVTALVDLAVRSYVMAQVDKANSSHISVAAVLITLLWLAYECSRWLVLSIFGAIVFAFLFYLTLREIDARNASADVSLADCTSIFEWLKSAKTHTHIPPRWTEIGQEVYSRKTLLNASARQLASMKMIDGDAACFRLAATDVFVEKAQRLLSHRAQILMLFGIISAIVSVAGMLAVGWYVAYGNGVVIPPGSTENPGYLALHILKASSAGALVTAAFYLLVSLTRALLHEATTLYSRRHSLRFGRLYVYLKKGSVSFEELEKAFQWNAEYKSAFKDIKSDKVTESILKSLVKSPAELLKALGALYPKKKGESLLLGVGGESLDQQNQ